MAAAEDGRPVLVYDGDCGFCTSSARWLARWVRPDATVVAWQHADLAVWGLTPEACADAVQWVDVDGSVASGHRAVAAVLGRGGPRWRVVGRLLVAPGLSWLAAGGYGLVARNRGRLPGGTPACRLPSDRRPGA